MKRSLALVLVLLAVAPSATKARGMSSWISYLHDRREDEHAIREMIDASTVAWNAGDAVGYVAVFDPDATFTTAVGATLVGKKAFQAYSDELLHTIFRASHLAQAVAEVRFVSKDIVLLDIETRLTDFAALPAGLKPSPDGSLHTRLEEVVVRSLGGWRVISFHDVDEKVPPSPS